MKKIALIVALILVFSLVATACNKDSDTATTPAPGGSSPAPASPAPASPAPASPAPASPAPASPADNSPAPAPEPAGPVDLSTLTLQRDIAYSTNPVGSGNYTFAASHAAVWNEILGINVTVVPESGADGIIFALDGDADLGIVNGYYGREYWLGGLEDSYNCIRVLLVGEPLCFSFIVNENSGIKTIDDLRGKRVTYQGLSQSHTLMAESILGAYGITEADITPLPMSSSNAGLEDLAEGRTDAVIASIAGAKMDELAAKITPYVIEFNDMNKAMEIMELSNSLLVPAKIHNAVPGTYSGANLLASVNEILCRVEIDDDTAYALTRVNLENTDALAAMHPDLQYWNSEVAVDIYSAYYPYHAGAIKYYKEVGLWTAEAEAWNNALLAQYGQSK